jgi:Uma2 family endonuclease
MSTAPVNRRFTVEEYLVLEEDSETKHEYYKGEIFAMAGASIRHNEISGNIFATLHGRLRGTGCRPYNADQRIRVHTADLYTYSDTLIVCGPLERDEKQSETIANPRVVFEVPSKSTERNDRGRKFEFYQQLESLQEYVLVSQSEPTVTHFVRDGSSWRYVLIQGLDQSVALESVPCTMTLSEIYENVTFVGPDQEEMEVRDL